MRYILSVFLLIFVGLSVTAQRLSETEKFNTPETAVFINGVFVKSTEGFNTNTKGANVHFEIKDAPCTINGVSYKQQFYIVDDRPIYFISLEDFRKKVLPDQEERELIYIINDKIITVDLESYMLDNNFIRGYEIIDGKSFNPLKKNNIVIFRIFTKNYLKLRLQ